MLGPLPLLGLRAFVCTGRSGSMKAAASALGVTPGAVSQQIRDLELRLGRRLFDRLNREVRLTADGRRLLDEIADPFSRIEQAVSRFHRGRNGATLVVSTTGAFAAAWLVPRLGRFNAAHPGIDVQILTTQALMPLGSGPGEADIAIRHGLGDWPGMHAQCLMRPRLLPVGSPALMAAGPQIQVPADCLAYPLLHDAAAQDWRLWLKAVGAETRDRRLRHGARFSDSTLLVRAALAGQGLALLRDTYIVHELATGQLHVVHDAPWPASFAYYVVTTAGANSRAVSAFRKWLDAEADRSESAK